MSGLRVWPRPPAQLAALTTCLVLAAITLLVWVDRASASPSAPSVTTGAASFVEEGKATLQGSVNPNGSTVSDCHFEYGPTTRYGASVPCAQSVGGGSEPVAVSAAISGLPTNTLYHFRLVATNGGGPGQGEDQSFSTPPPPPSVRTWSASMIGQTSATLQGYVGTYGSTLSDCHFDYGTSPSFGSSAPCAQGTSTGAEPSLVSAVVVGLQPSAFYYFRLVASSPGGTSYGNSLLFQTVSLSSPKPTLPVTPPYPPSSSPNPWTYPTIRYTPPRQHPVARCMNLKGRRRTRCLTAGRRRYRPNPNDAGLYVAYCPGNAGASSIRATVSGTSEAGWPPKQCLKMDKGNAGQHHTLVGQHGVHNWLLGGYGNDTIIGGNIGDVIWADYQPEGEPRWQSATIHAGNGRNVIYANDTVNYVWTGTNPRTVVHAHNPGTSGVIHCQSSGIVVFLSKVSQRDFKLDGCQHISHFSVGY
jgi:hypothetical protein